MAPHLAAVVAGGIAVGALPRADLHSRSLESIFQAAGECCLLSTYCVGTALLPSFCALTLLALLLPCLVLHFCMSNAYLLPVGLCCRCFAPYLLGCSTAACCSLLCLELHSCIALVGCLSDVHRHPAMHGIHSPTCHACRASLASSYSYCCDLSAQSSPSLAFTSLPVPCALHFTSCLSCSNLLDEGEVDTVSRHMLLGTISGRLGQVVRTGLSKNEIATMHCTPLAQILKELPNGSATKINAQRAAMAPKMRFDPSPVYLCLLVSLPPSVSLFCLYSLSLFLLSVYTLVCPLSLSLFLLPDFVVSFSTCQLR